MECVGTYPSAQYEDGTKTASASSGTRASSSASSADNACSQGGAAYLSLERRRHGCGCVIPYPVASPGTSDGASGSEPHGTAGRPGNRPKELKGDPAYDLELLRGELRKGGTEPLPNWR